MNRKGKVNHKFTEQRMKVNAETQEALKESRREKLKSYKTLDEFWKAVKINPDA